MSDSVQTVGSQQPTGGDPAISIAVTSVIPDENDEEDVKLQAIYTGSPTLSWEQAYSWYDPEEAEDYFGAEDVTIATFTISDMTLTNFDAFRMVRCKATYADFFGGVMATKKKQMDNARKLPFSELHEIALKEAQKIHREKVEHGVAIDEYGKVTHFRGNENTVDIDVNESTSIILHNHPHEFKEPSSFSSHDVYYLLHWGLKEIIVCGYGYIFYMRRGECTSLAIDVMRQIGKIYKNVERAEKKKFTENSLTDSDNISIHYQKMRVQIEQNYHKELKVYAKEEGLSYDKVKL